MRKCLSDERNTRQSVGDNWFEMFRMASFAYFECQCGNFELDPVSDGKPVKPLDDRRDIIIPHRSSDDTS